MSDSKRSKKYSNLKDSKRTIILSKRDEDPSSSSQSSTTHQQPKILTKSKEAIQPTQHVPSISILREGVTKLPQSPSNINVSANKDCKELIAPIIVEQPTIAQPIMQKPVNIITDHYALNSQAFDYIVESNTNFFVVGAIGVQGIGKSTLMNILCTNSLNTDNTDTTTTPPPDTFQTRNIKERLHSSTPKTEGIEMYITNDRIIYLDCSPILCNPYKKDHALNEIDDLKMIIFLLNVCHLLIIVQDDGLNMNMIRLVLCAEMIKPNFDRKDYTANVMFVKNMAETKDFSADNRMQTERLIKLLFKQSKMNIYPGNVDSDDDAWTETMVSTKQSPIKVKPVNLLYFPRIEKKKSKDLYKGYPDIDILINEFRQRVYFSPRKQFQSTIPQGSFTEKHWSQLATNVWDSHKNNYFLRKYETFKEKEWQSRPINS